MHDNAFDRLHELFSTAGYTRTKELAKVWEYRSPRNSQIVYLNLARPSAPWGVVIHPRVALRPFRSVPGIGVYGHRSGSNYTSFPKKLGRRSPIHYGNQLIFEDRQILLSILTILDAHVVP